MKSRVVEQVEKILEGVSAVEDITEIERLIAEAKKKVSLEPSVGFWKGKRPCWEICQCPDFIRNECPTPKYQSFPCWEIEGTFCKLDDYGTTGVNTSVCEVCQVYNRYGENKPIQIRLFGKGMDTSLSSVEKARGK